MSADHLLLAGRELFDELHEAELHQYGQADPRGWEALSEDERQMHNAAALRLSLKAAALRRLGRRRRQPMHSTGNRLTVVIVRYALAFGRDSTEELEEWVADGSGTLLPRLARLELDRRRRLEDQP